MPILINMVERLLVLIISIGGRKAGVIAYYIDATSSKAYKSKGGIRLKQLHVSGDAYLKQYRHSKLYLDYKQQRFQLRWNL